MNFLRDIPDEILAVSFEENSVRLAALKHSGKLWRAIDVDALPVALSSETQDKIQQGMRDFVKKCGFKKTFGITSSWDQGFIERPVVLPDMPESEIRAAITFGIEQNFHLKLDECLYQWLPSAEVASAQGVKARQYFVYAVRNDDAKVYRDTLEGVSSHILSYSPRSVSLSVLLASIIRDIRHDAAVLDIGTTTSKLIIFRSGKPVLLRNIDIGGDELKKEDVSSNAFESLKEAVEGTIIYYRQQSYSGDINEAFIVGCGSKIAGLSTLLERAVEISFAEPMHKESMDLFLDIKAESTLRDDFADYAACLGSFVTWRSNIINLAPKNILSRNALRIHNKLFVWILALLITACTAYVFSASMSVMTRQRKLVSITSDVNASKGVLGVFEELQTHRAFKKTLSKGSMSAMGFMKLLSIEIPSETTLDTIHYDRSSRKIEITGRIYKKVPDFLGHCSGLVKALSESPFLEKADLVEGVSNETNEEYRFKIRGFTYES